MPGPLSSIATRKRSSAMGEISTKSSGRMPASSQASSELSTASLTAVSSALSGESKPSRCRFFVKNSATEISRWREAISSALARRPGSFDSLSFGLGSVAAGSPASATGSSACAGLGRAFARGAPAAGALSSSLFVFFFSTGLAVFCGGASSSSSKSVAPGVLESVTGSLEWSKGLG